MVDLSPASPSLRCAAVTRADHVDPVGTAGTYDGYLAIEWPLPWPRDLAESPELAPIVTALAGTGIRLQGIVAPATADRVRVVLHRRDGGRGFRSFGRLERVVPRAEAVEAAVELLAAGSATRLDDDARAGHATEVLVCTHGQRDVCCGSLGTALALALEATRALGDVRVLRTSHTGGHRFAPTAIVLPEATAWAFLDADALCRIVTRTGPLDELLPRYRGCAGLTSPRVQALERTALADVGWSWFDRRRHGTDLGDGRVRLEADEDEAGPVMTWEASVDVRRSVVVPTCGRPVDEASKSEPEWTVHDVRRR